MNDQVIPIMVTVRIGPGAMQEGLVVGEASIVIGHQIDGGTCPHAVILAVIKHIDKAVVPALSEAMKEAKKRQQEGKKDDEAPSTLVA